MKKLTLLLIAFLLCTSFWVTNTKTIDKGWYRVCYSETYQEPVWVEYTVACTEGKFSRKGLDFYLEPGIKTADNADFEANEWDKGHMAPAADFACDSLALRATFSYLNCALQQENLNRGVWRHLETRERELAKQWTVKVRIDVVNGPSKKTLSTGARIPDAFIKTLSYGSNTEVYRFPNTKPTSSDPQAYRVNK